MQCQATTKLGTQCSRKAIAGEIYCSQHLKIYGSQQTTEVKENLYDVLEDLVFDYIPLNDYLELMKTNPKVYTAEKYVKLQAKAEKDLADQLSTEYRDETNKALKYIDDLIIEKKDEIQRLSTASDTEINKFYATYGHIYRHTWMKYFIKLIEVFRISNTFDDIIDVEERTKIGLGGLIGYQLINHFDISLNYKLLVNYNDSRSRTEIPSSITIFKIGKDSDKRILNVTNLKSLSPLWKLFAEIGEDKIGWETNRKIYNIYKKLKRWD
jgi:hypothetical protein